MRGPVAREYDYLAVGHLTLDDVGRERLRLGGAAAYGSVLAAGLGLSAGVVSVVGEDFPRDRLDWLRRHGVELSGVAVRRGPSTRFRIVSGPSRVVSSLSSRARPLQVADVAPFRGKITHLGPVAGEISREVALQCASSCEVLVVDLQGFLRKFDRAGRVSLSPEGLNSLEGIQGVVHANESEARGTTGLTDPLLAARALSRRFGLAAVTLGERGAVVSGPDGTVIARPPTVNAEDDVGAGDVFCAALGAALINDGRVDEAARFAVAAAAASTKFAGPRPIPLDLIGRLERDVRITYLSR